MFKVENIVFCPFKLSGLRSYESAHTLITKKVIYKTYTWSTTGMYLVGHWYVPQVFIWSAIGIYLVRQWYIYCLPLV